MRNYVVLPRRDQHPSVFCVKHSAGRPLNSPAIANAGPAIVTTVQIQL
jgi:hypothetical protein